MANENVVRYSFYPSGTFTIIEGRLGSDLEIKVLESGKKLVKFSIATNAGSKKKEDGSYDNLTDWHSITIWDNGGASAVLFDAISNPPSDKLVFKKGNQVVLYCHATKNLRVYEGKAYCDTNVTQFYHLYKVLGNTNTSNSEQNTTEFDNSKVPIKPELEF